MRYIDTEILIDAPPPQVWKHLIDWESYADWIPLIHRIQGEPVEGARLEATVQPAGGNSMDIAPMVVVVRPNEELRWIGKLLIPGLFSGEHSFHLKPVDGNRTQFRRAEKFTGLLVPLMWGSFGPGTTEGFNLMNEALKTRVENEI
jgi:hypothetical protein